MTLKVWRISHLLLAIISSAFLLIASLSGAILSLEPIYYKSQTLDIYDLDLIKLSDVLILFESENYDVLSFEIDDYQKIEANIVSFREDLPDGNVFLNPTSGEVISKVEKKSPFITLITNLHKSLFLKTIGRFLIGLVSFLLILIALSGFALVLKRSGGMQGFFQSIRHEKKEAYLHLLLSRFFLVPILIIALSGIILSAYRFEVLPDSWYNSTTIEDHEVKSVSNAKFDSSFSVFDSLTLGAIKKFEYPFSNAADDYYKITTQNEIILIDQYNGGIVSSSTRPIGLIIKELSFYFHTGSGYIIWPIILFFACFALIFLIFTGFRIYYERSKIKLTKSSVSPDLASTVILVGSENGSTKEFAKTLYNFLSQSGLTDILIDDLDTFQFYPRIKRLVILTSTYGEGEPPSNAVRFIKALNEYTSSFQDFEYSIVGFGSTHYRMFCGFAVQIESEFQKFSNAKEIIPLELIDNKSNDAFLKWVKKWVAYYSLGFKDLHIEKVNRKVFSDFELIQRDTYEGNYGTFSLLRFRSNTSSFESGDLIEILPPNTKDPRPYSIAKISNSEFVICVSLVPKGLCSNYLTGLNKGFRVKGELLQNSHFYRPESSVPVIMVANGTGIGPFLGMFRRKSINQLYWGIHDKGTYLIAEPFLREAINNNNLGQIEIAFSQEGECNHVQDLLAKDRVFILSHIERGGCIMLCGSLAMQKSVEEILDTILKDQNTSLTQLRNERRLVSDCY